MSDEVLNTTLLCNFLITEHFAGLGAKVNDVEGLMGAMHQQGQKRERCRFEDYDMG